MEVVEKPGSAGFKSACAYGDVRALMLLCAHQEVAMTNPDVVKHVPRRHAVKRARSTAPEANGKRPVHVAVLREAEAAGLLAGEKTEHVSFRATPALIRAAKEETGVTSTSELGMLALALLARPDPVASFLKRTRGRLGPDHDLDY